MAHPIEEGRRTTHPPDPTKSKVAPGAETGATIGAQDGLTKANLAGGKYPVEIRAASLPTIIATIEKNSVETVVVALDQFRGVDLLDIRIFAVWGGDEKPRATKKGVALKIEHLPALVKALQQATAEARKRGLLPDERSAGAIRQERHRAKKRHADNDGRNADVTCERNAPVMQGAFELRSRAD